MALRTTLLLSVITLSFWTQSCMTSSVERTSEEEEEEDSSNKLQLPDRIDIATIDRLEEYLYDIRERLEARDGRYDGPRPEHQGPPDDAGVLKRVSPSGFYGVRGRSLRGRPWREVADSSPGYKRRTPTGFYGVRGRRADEVGRPDRYEDTADYRSGSKRRAPTGFHSVRGRRTDPAADQVSPQTQRGLLNMIDYYRHLYNRRTAGG